MKSYDITHKQYNQNGMNNAKVSTLLKLFQNKVIKMRVSCQEYV